MVVVPTSDIHIKMTIPNIKYTTDQTRKFTIDFRVAANSDAGEVSLDLVDESTGRFIEVMDNLTLPVTNDWQVGLPLQKHK